jgi:hypothetical protein
VLPVAEHVPTTSTTVRPLSHTRDDKPRSRRSYC